jgi:hypothetical protein
VFQVRQLVTWWEIRLVSQDPVGVLTVNVGSPVGDSVGFLGETVGIQWANRG